MLLLLLIACGPVDVSWTTPGAVTAPGVLALPADRDDDDWDGVDDWEARQFSEAEDDWAELSWEATVPPTLVVPQGGLRIWADGVELLSGAGRVALPAAGMVQVQAKEPGSHQELTLVPGAPGPATTVSVEVLPALVASHLDVAEHLWVVEAADPDRGLDSREMVEELRALLGEQLTVIDAEAYWYDLWVQDELQWAWVDEERQVVLDSIRDRNLDDYPEEQLLGPQHAVLTYGEGLPRNQDGFGNLEAFPPLDTGLVGPTYVGFNGELGPRDGLLDFLEQQGQQMLTVDVSWLCVGHVDEVMAVVPDAGAPRGFVVWLSDPRVLRTLLEQADPDLALPRYAQDFGYATVGELLDDTGLWTLNEQLAQDHIDPLADVLLDGLGLEEAELLRVPALYDEWNACSGRVSAVLPSLVNLQVVHPDGEPLVLLADPWMRDGDDRGDDLVLRWLTDNVSADWAALEAWETYHLNGGQVHCGTAVRRSL